MAISMIHPLKHSKLSEVFPMFSCILSCCHGSEHGKDEMHIMIDKEKEEQNERLVSCYIAFRLT